MKDIELCEKGSEKVDFFLSLENREKGRMSLLGRCCGCRKMDIYNLTMSIHPLSMPPKIRVPPLTLAGGTQNVPLRSAGTPLTLVGLIWGVQPAKVGVGTLPNYV